MKFAKICAITILAACWDPGCPGRRFALLPAASASLWFLESMGGHADFWRNYNELALIVTFRYIDGFRIYNVSWSKNENPKHGSWPVWMVPTLWTIPSAVEYGVSSYSPPHYPPRITIYLRCMKIHTYIRYTIIINIQMYIIVRILCIYIYTHHY